MPTRKTLRALLAPALILTRCATASLPPPGVAERARSVSSYTARVSVSLKGNLEGRARALVAFERPDALRLEIPGPSGLRLLAVARASCLLAVFPAERALYAGPATAEGLGALLGVPLSPSEIMDLLLGVPSPRLRSYRVSWGKRFPRQVDATLPDGGTLRALVEDADESPLPKTAFEEPAHDGYRRVEAEEARSLLRAGR